MASETPQDVWSVGERYEPYVGRWSRRIAEELLYWLAVPPNRDWIDVGCGTGAVTATIVERAAPRSVAAIDSSAGFVAHARARVADARVTFEVADAEALPLVSASCDVAVSGLVLNFITRLPHAVAEMRRVLRSHGIGAAYVWDYAGKMEMMRYFWDAAVASNPAAAALDEGRRFPMCEPRTLHALYASAGLRDVEVRAIDVLTRFRDFDDYWSPFLGGQGPAPAYVAALADAERERLREMLRRRLPFARDGSIPLVARAWAVRGYAR